VSNDLSLRPFLHRKMLMNIGTPYAFSRELNSRFLSRGNAFPLALTKT
jgi:hypothetical protein